MRRAARAFLLASMLLTAPGLAAAGAHATPATSSDFADRLQAALSSGDWTQVDALFDAKDTPLYAYLEARWSDMRRRVLNPVAWEVSFAPYDAQATAPSGQLWVAAKQASGPRVGARFDLSLVPRGTRLLAGDPIHYDDQDVSLDAQALAIDVKPDGAVSVADTLTLAPLGPDRTVYLNLGRDWQVDAVQAGQASLRFRQLNEILAFARPAGATLSAVTIRYHARHAFTPAGGVSLHPGDRWVPALVASDAFCRFTTTVSVPAGWVADAPGRPDGVTSDGASLRYSWTADAPVSGLSLLAGALAHSDPSGGAVPIAAFAAPELLNGLTGLVPAADQALHFFADGFGPYPYDKLSLVAANQSADGLDTVALPPEALAAPAIASRMIAHELAYGWVGQTRYRGTPGERAFMSEGTAAYLAMLCHAAQSGGTPVFRRELRESQKRYRALSGSASDVAIAAADPDLPRGVYQRLVDDKASLVLHMLRRQVGDRAFMAALRGLYHDRRGGTTTIDDFRAAFEAASKQHLGYFFDEWVNRPGLADIQVGGLAARPLSKGRFEIRGVLAQSGEAYAMGLPIVVQSSRGNTVYLIDVHAAQTPFTLLVPGAPRAMLIDPLGDTLLAHTPWIFFKGRLPPTRTTQGLVE